MLRPGGSFVLTVAVLFVAGCASLSRGPANDADPAEVSGTYEIEHFEFVPLASALDRINLLEYVEEDGSTLELIDSQDSILTYRTKDGGQVKVTGPYGLTSEHVKIEGQEKDEARFKRIQLDRTFTLARKTPTTLLFGTQTEISPAASRIFSPHSR